MLPKTIQQRAQAAYFKHSSGPIRQPAGQPEFYEVGEREYVTLANVNGLLACYRIQKDGSLRRLQSPPKEIASLY